MSDYEKRVLRKGLRENLVWLSVRKVILKTTSGMGGLQPSAMKLVFVPKCCNSGFFSLKWKLYIMVLHISNINRWSDSQTVCGNDKTGCHSPGKLYKLSHLWEGFWSACCPSQIQKVGNCYVVSYWTFWKSTPYWNMWENHKNIQNSFKMAWPLLFFVIFFKYVLFFILLGCKVL